MNEVSKAYIITFTGKKFNLLEPRLQDIDFEDIGHSQAMLCRWTGHCKFHYSIAQHGYYCSFIGDLDPRKAMKRLVHDGSESYLGDMNRPLKHFTDAGEAYRRVEWPLQNLIYEAAGVPGPEEPDIKFADEAMLYAEMEQLLPPTDRTNWVNNNPFGESKAADIKIERWTPDFAEFMFKRRFRELYERIVS